VVVKRSLPCGCSILIEKIKGIGKMSDLEKTAAIFEGYKIRRHYDEDNEVWYFSYE